MSACYGESREDKKVKQYRIIHTQTVPDWKSVPVLSVDEYLWGSPKTIGMEAQICYDETAVYLHLTAHEQNIRAVYHEPMSMVCEDSCMEFFFSPKETDCRYINFEINPNGCTYIGIGYDRYEHIRLACPDEEELFSKHTGRTEDGWEVFFRIPVSFLGRLFPGFELTSGSVIRANVYKCGDLTVQPHFIAWNPVTSTKPDFHRSCDFGEMILGQGT